MNKKKEDTVLSWRLKDLPDAIGVAELVAQGVIDKDEARSLLFNDRKQSDKDEENKALKEQVKFYEKIIESLSQRNYTNITFTPSYPIRHWIPTVVSPAITYVGSTSGARITAGAVGGSGVKSLSVNTGNLLN